MNTEEWQGRPTSELPEDFIEQVKQILGHLYDFSFLQQHPLASILSAAQKDESIPSGQLLRREIIAAIETLNPGDGIAFHSPHARLYNLMTLRYLESMSVLEAAQELAISLRQTHRDLRRAEENVASILWDRCCMDSTPSTARNSSESQAGSLQAEMSLLKLHLQPTDIVALIRQARKAVESLATLYNVILSLEVPSQPVFVSTDAGIAQQVLINMLSKAIQQAREGPLYAVLKHDKRNLRFSLHYPARPEGSTGANRAIISSLVERLGWTIHQEDLPNRMQQIVLSINSQDRILLLVDDNESLTKLLDRFLVGRGLQVIGAQDGQIGMKLAQELKPDVIVLDVMLPEMNGWELLQRLRANPATVNTPIIICSVFNDPELAYSLGAARFLSKPVQQTDLLAALSDLGII